MSFAFAGDLARACPGVAEDLEGGGKLRGSGGVDVLLAFSESQ